MTSLRIQGLTKRFGGLTALESVDIEAESASILSIIGPNGSGKTTLFNCISGLYEPTAGEVLLVRDGVEQSLLGLRPDQITRAGLSRTFQTIRLFPMMTVLENVLVGMHSTLATSTASAALRTQAFRIEEREAASAAQSLLEFFGEHLSPRSGDLARNLSYANQRRLEIARCMITNTRTDPQIRQ